MKNDRLRKVFLELISSKFTLKDDQVMSMRKFKKIERRIKKSTSNKRNYI